MGRKRILIVDDEEAVRIMMAAVLKVNDYIIDLAENGMQAMDYISKKPYDLIITDYTMPKMDGFELARNIRSRYPSIPILLVTGSHIAFDLMKSEVTDYIIKPFNLFDLLNRVDMALSGRLDDR